MDQALDFIQANINIAPYLIFGLLLLAGFNLPVSEDGMLFVSGLLASKYPDKTPLLFAAVFLGAYLSDLICYGFIGRYLGPKMFKVKFFSKMITQEKVDKMSAFYEKYGIMTLILGRFIPFGVRNALFLTAGLGKMNALKFALSDLLACVISCTSFFWLYKTYGETVIVYVKKGNMIIFSIAILVAFAVYVKKRKERKSAKNV